MRFVIHIVLFVNIFTVLRWTTQLQVHRQKYSYDDTVCQFTHINRELNKNAPVRAFQNIPSQPHWTFRPIVFVTGCWRRTIHPWHWLKNCLEQWVERFFWFYKRYICEISRARKRETTQCNSAKLTQPRPSRAAIARTHGTWKTWWIAWQTVGLGSERPGGGKDTDLYALCTWNKVQRAVTACSTSGILFIPGLRPLRSQCLKSSMITDDDDELMLNVLRCHLTY